MTDPAGGEGRRTAIVEVAAELLHAHGPTGVTTRAVAAGAGVQAPTIYRLFGDKDGLLDAVAEHVFAGWVTDKARAEQSDDPVADLRAGWETHLGFGLANPGLYGLLNEPGRGARSPATAAGIEVLRARVHRVAAAGRLRVAEQRAVELIHSAGTGTVLTLLAAPPEARDPGLADAMWAALASAVLTDPPHRADDAPTTASVAFRTVVPDLPGLTDAERTLLTEWLDRAIAT